MYFVLIDWVLKLCLSVRGVLGLELVFRDELVIATMGLWVLGGCGGVVGSVLVFLVDVKVEVVSLLGHLFCNYGT